MKKDSELTHHDIRDSLNFIIAVYPEFWFRNVDGIRGLLAPYDRISNIPPNELANFGHRLMNFVEANFIAWDLLTSHQLNDFIKEKHIQKPWMIY